MALKTYTGSMTDGSFNRAVNDVFIGIAGRQNQLHQLLLIAFAKAQTERTTDSGDTVTTDDFRWISTILAKAIETKGLNSSRMADWVSSCVTSPDSTVPLKWDKKTSQLKKSKSGIRLVYDVQGTWFDYGKDPDITKSFEFAKRLESLLKSAAKAYEDGTMPDADKAAYLEFIGLSRKESTVKQRNA